ncbi:MAG TPA: dynamin family protein [Terriglobia bacterium]|nr:dynamin family protein [Terriglobia bacterium]
MFLRTHDTESETSDKARPTGPDRLSPDSLSQCRFEPILNLVEDVARRYEISALSGLLASTRSSVGQDEISVAVLGRFKAGKSSFLNHFIGREILPVGVVPVTAVVTEIRYGVREEARVRHRDGRDPEIPLGQIGGYISEKENPENTKQVDVITVELPELRRFRSLKFVDTPGLESALSHNTQTSLDWLPNVGLALVAVSVDPPLSQRDIDLLRSLYQYTPKVGVLLTKADLLSEQELAEVIEYVRSQLAKNFAGTPQIFPYSTRPGFERFRQALEAELVTGTLERFAEERESILSRKMETLVRECGDYLALSLKSAEMVQSERRALKQQVIGEKEVVDEAKSAIRLVVQHAAGSSRSMVSHQLETHQSDLERTLLDAFEGEFPKWTRSLATMLSSFEEWLAAALCDELTALSIRERTSFVAPLHKVRKQAFRTLQQFRDRLSDRTLRAFGVPLRTTETEIDVVEPSTPDIRIGRVFDRNWELLSPALPVWMIKTAVHRHFSRTIAYLVYQNLSRLSTQWEESTNGALWEIEKEARRRLDELIGTVEHLLESSSNERAPQLRADLERLEQARKSLGAEARD